MMEGFVISLETGVRTGIYHVMENMVGIKIGAEDRWHLSIDTVWFSGWISVRLGKLCMTAQSTSVLIMQSFPSLREIQPENWVVSMDKCYLFAAPMLEVVRQAPVAQLISASDQNSKDLVESRLDFNVFFHHDITVLHDFNHLVSLSSWVLRAINVKGDGSVQSGSYIQGHHIFKNIWNHAVLERLNYDPYKVVILNMCLCLRSMLYCFINLLDIFLENQEALTVYIFIIL